MYATYEEWNSQGRYVKKGSKSKLRCPETNLPLFHKKQTEEMDRGPDLSGYYVSDIY